MSRAERLLQLMQTLRRHRQPVVGQALAEELGVSVRTLYRDIASLQAQGAQIEGEPGLGYVLRPGFTLPPLMFSEEEIDALVLGSRWVAERGDAVLSEAARNALAKITAVLPPALRHAADSTALLVGPASEGEVGTPSGDRGERPAPALRPLPSAAAISRSDDPDQHLLHLRRAIRGERRLTLHYVDQHGQPSERALWPCAVGFFDRCLVLVAWCELRQDFRHFRVDRITGLQVHAERYPQRRQALLQRWRRQEGVAER